MWASRLHYAHLLSLLEKHSQIHPCERLAIESQAEILHYGATTGRMQGKPHTKPT